MLAPGHVPGRPHVAPAAPAAPVRPFVRVWPWALSASLLVPPSRAARPARQAVCDAREKLKSLQAEAPEHRAEKIFELFPYELDPAQKEAAYELACGKDVLCSLPTGAGKTAIAIFAAWHALSTGGRIIYTSPLKALSAQKYREFTRIFGEEAVGLVTGDHCVVPDAPLVVMTTEILRNKLYNDLVVSLVVLDELHWISDASRGRAWEEVLINSPKAVQFLHLSGSVGQAERFCAWAESVRQRPCRLIESQERPVPLHFYMMLRSQDARRRRCFHLWKATQGEEKDLAEEEQLDPKLLVGEWQELPDVDHAQGIQRVRNLQHMIRRLQRLHWLPCLCFSMQRRRCEAQVQDALVLISLGTKLVTPRETALIDEALETYKEKFPDLSLSSSTVAALRQGVAAHHAGQMPAQRALVECLFERTLLKLVFATETLAVGIHMPARAVVVHTVSKKDGFGPRRVNSTELLQMAGRAGRRSLDLQGHVVLHGPVRWTAETLAAGPLPLSSSFRPSYDMLCGLFAKGRTEKDLEELVRKSFAAYLGQSEEEDHEELQLCGAVLQEARKLLEQSGCTEEEVQDYEMSRRLEGHSDDDLQLFETGKMEDLDFKDDLVTALKRRRDVLSRLPRMRPRHGWPTFQRYISVLEEADFLVRRGELVFSSSKGQVAQAITQGANILWLSCLLPKPIGDDLAADLPPADLAALVAAMTTESRHHFDVDLKPEVLQQLRARRWQILELQLRHGVQEPLPLCGEAFRICRAWASGAAWASLSGARDEGDVFRLLRRSLEVLEGLERCLDNDAWQSQLREAQQLLMRCPVAENQQVETGELLPFT